MPPKSKLGGSYMSQRCAHSYIKLCTQATKRATSQHSAFFFYSDGPILFLECAYRILCARAR
eukprot:2093776-Pleurochrysis_carterae.AAC.1